MGRGTSLTRVIAAAVAALAVLVVLPQVAGAVLSGTNGRIVFTSGRDVASDAEASCASGGGPRRPSTPPSARR